MIKRWFASLVGADVEMSNHCENQIRPWTMGRKAWLFAGSELAGQRAAVVIVGADVEVSEWGCG